MTDILTFNQISDQGLRVLRDSGFTVGPEVSKPVALILRSHVLNAKDVVDTVLAVGRAGAGVNNIPVEALSERGVVVFNSPGANANAVKELVMTGLLLCTRHIHAAWQFIAQLDGQLADLAQRIEQEKKRFKGIELVNRTIGVIGLGKIGVAVANCAVALGMRVIGFDPSITITNAWALSREVQQADSMAEVLQTAEFITLHVPLNAATNALINKQQIDLMTEDCVLLNFSRARIVDEAALLTALQNKTLGYYVCDFPSKQLLQQDNVICLPHLGASTIEAEQQCAMMVANQLRDFIQHGHIENAVNFPNIRAVRQSPYRLGIANRNVESILAQITQILSLNSLNILSFNNKSKGQLAYTLIDTHAPCTDDILAALSAIEGVLHVRVINEHKTA